MSVAPSSSQNRIMIYGPKRARWRDPRAQVFPGANAVRAVRARRSV